MLDELVGSLPQRRHAALTEERSRLNRQIEMLYAIPEDRTLARIPDAQGLGGSVGPHP